VIQVRSVEGSVLGIGTLLVLLLLAAPARADRPLTTCSPDSEKRLEVVLDGVPRPRRRRPAKSIIH
jgi:hypothetical protein